MYSGYGVPRGTSLGSAPCWAGPPPLSHPAPSQRWWQSPKRASCPHRSSKASFCCPSLPCVLSFSGSLVAVFIKMQASHLVLWNPGESPDHAGGALPEWPLLAPGPSRALPGGAKLQGGLAHRFASTVQRSTAGSSEQLTTLAGQAPSAYRTAQKCWATNNQVTLSP